MNRCIKHINIFLSKHPKLKQWLWFAILWFGGLFAVYSMSMVIKLMMKNF
jgi:uncharacterized membrane protein